MTSAAQQALRRTLELYSNSTHFALACNVSTQIIKPTQSCAAILHYTCFSDEQVLLHLKQVSYTNDGLEAIIYTPEGDLRNALNNLQATQSRFGHMNQANVFKVCDQPHPTNVKNIIVVACLKGNTSNAVKEMMAL